MIATTDRIPGPNTQTKRDAFAFAEDNPQMRALLEIADELQWPIGYQDDLYVHDRRSIVENADSPREYVFIIRDMGTHLYPLTNEGEKPDRHITECALAGINWHSGTHKVNFYSDEERRPRMYHIRRNGSYKPITPEAALALVYKRGGQGCCIGP